MVGWYRALVLLHLRYQASTRYCSHSAVSRPRCHLLDRVITRSTELHILGEPPHPPVRVPGHLWRGTWRRWGGGSRDSGKGPPGESSRCYIGMVGLCWCHVWLRPPPVDATRRSSEAVSNDLEKEPLLPRLLPLPLKESKLWSPLGGRWDDVGGGRDLDICVHVTVCPTR